MYGKWRLSERRTKFESIIFEISALNYIRLDVRNIEETRFLKDHNLSERVKTDYWQTLTADDMAFPSIDSKIRRTKDADDILTPLDLE